MKKINKYNILFLFSFAVSLKREYTCMKKISGRVGGQINLSDIYHAAFRITGLLWNLVCRAVEGNICFTLAFPAPALLPGKSHEWRSLVGCSPWGR